MPNSKSLTGAIALLALIAVLDNFVFVELEPGFEGMVLVDTPDTTVDAAPAAHRFWIDKQQVDAADFARFLATTHYAPTQASNASITHNASAPVASGGDAWTSQAENARWQQPPAGGAEITLTPETGSSEFQFTVEAARAYCNWLGKVLPTEEQYALARREVNFGREGYPEAETDSGLSFRCARMQSLSAR